MQFGVAFEEGTEDDIEFYSGEEEVPTTKKNNKRRFSDEQVRSLEAIFSSETKLEQKKKVQVARELGLQPRQVAIWFQNKRARWKSKQIEMNYKVLKANYDNLRARFQDISKEKETLLEQLQELHSLSEKSSIANNEQFDGENRNTIPGLSEIEHQGGNMEHMAKDEPAKLMNDDVNIDGAAAAAAMISSVKWCGLDSTNLLDHQSSTNSQWWNSWT